MTIVQDKTASAPIGTLKNHTLSHRSRREGTPPGYLYLKAECRVLSGTLSRPKRQPAQIIRVCRVSLFEMHFLPASRLYLHRFMAKTLSNLIKRPCASVADVLVSVFHSGEQE